MSNSQMTPSSSNGLIDITNNDIIDLTDSPLDLSDMIKQTVHTIGLMAFLSREIEHGRSSIVSYKEKNPAIMNNKVEILQRDIDQNIQKFDEQQNLAVEGVRRIADRYRESFTIGLEDVRESIEDSMIKFGTTLSEDALNQITQRSAALSEAVAKITSEQHKKITHETDDIKSQLTHYDDKYTELNESVTKYTKTVDRLNSSSIHCVRVIANNNNRISAIQEKQDDMYSKFNKDLDALKERLAGFTPMLKKMQGDLTATFKKDMSTLSATLTDFQTRQNDDRKTLEQLKSANASIKQQVADLFSTDPKHSSKNTNWNNLKSQIDKHEILVTDLQRRVDLVVRNDETLDEQDKWKSYSPTARLDKMENLVTQLSTKFNSIKQQLDLNKGASPPPQSGTKRSRDSALGSDDDDDKRKALEESIKLLDKKISSLSEFVYQFHSTILDPSFPHKLESTIHHLEDCLKNHERFIAYLVDPMKLITSDLPSLAVDLYKTPILATITQFVHDEVKKSDANKRLNDKAMTDYVKSYMNELAAKQVEPLKKKIKLLEQQLYDKASR